jgi:NDP-hexose 4-ketoreductase
MAFAAAMTYTLVNRSGPPGAAAAGQHRSTGGRADRRDSEEAAMEIVGRGFVARSLAPVAHRHPDVVTFASGVSSGASTAGQEFAREAALLYRTIEDCARRGRRLVYFSTAATTLYGGTLVIGRESGPVYPNSPYGRHKLAMEAVLASSRIDYLTLRLTHLVGPHQPAHQLPAVLLSQVRSGTVRIFRGVHRDFLATEDLAAILDRLLDTPANREVINIASGVPVPIEEIVDHVERRVGIAATRQYLHRPEPVVTICIDRLRARVPEVDRMGFDRGYYRRVLDTFIAHSMLVPGRG